jgi:putative nucleotidyltransferase with HDIG domain
VKVTKVTIVPPIVTLALGFTIGALTALGTLPEPGLTLTLFALASVAEWLKVHLGPMGTLTLRPAIALTALWLDGPLSFALVTILPIYAVTLFQRTDLKDASQVAFRAAIAAAAAYLMNSAASFAVDGQEGVLGSGIARLSAALAFFGTDLALQAVALSRAEAIRLPAVVGFLVRRAWPHVAALSASSLALALVSESFGTLLMGLVGIMLVEAYYPWKLLGEQGGALLTSLGMMAQAVDLKDPYTSNHSQRVSSYATRIARALELSEADVERVRIGGLMHDIGKIGISGRIIRKPGKLTAEEQALMRRHSSVSADIIEPLEILGESAAMVRHHHENWNGTGYPNGIAGDTIPLGSRIIFVADTFDAVTTDRPYRKGADKLAALKVLQDNAGTQFDPTVVAAMEKVIPNIQLSGAVEG